MRRWLLGTGMVITLALLVSIILVGVPTPAPAEAQVGGATGVMGTRVGAIAGSKSPAIQGVEISRSALAAEGPSPAQLAASKAHMAYRDAIWAARKEAGGPSTAAAAPPAPGTQTSTISAAVPGTFRIFRNSAALTFPPGYSSNINEPAVGAAGSNVFMTWNWRAALSVDGGLSWDDINPYADFPTFCCDQDVVYDRARHMIIWYRQGNRDATFNNQVKISRSTNGGATWCTYTITGASVGLAGRWFDYPHLALSNDYLYITSNMFTSAFANHVLMRWPLDAMATCSSLSFTFWTPPNGWTPTPVQGAREVMYLGDNVNSAGTFRVFTQPEANTTLSWVDRVIPAWTFTNKNAICNISTPSGTRNPCLRADQRIIASVVTNNTAGGVLSNGAITFFWNVAQGGSFPFPYVNAAAFSEATKTVLPGSQGRPFIWNASYTWFYAAAAPNERGDIGLTVYRFQTGFRPEVWASMDDDFNGNPPGWEVALVSGSAGYPSSNDWGDYSRVRPYYPGGTTWAASVYTKNAANVSEPRFVIFGRERDEKNVTRWWAQ